jgi:hypothetical protein
MIQQGVDFGIHLVLFPDVAERIAKLFDRRGIPQLFYAVAPAKTKKPYLVLPDFGTGMKIGRYLGEHAKKNWGGRVDAVVLMGQKQTGAISEYRTGGGRAGIESVLGKPLAALIGNENGGGTTIGRTVGSEPAPVTDEQRTPTPTPTSTEGSPTPSDSPSPTSSPTGEPTSPGPTAPTGEPTPVPTVTEPAPTPTVAPSP